jgi:hypothetical protein
VSIPPPTGPSEGPAEQQNAPDDMYVVVLVANGGARLPPGQRIQLNDLETDAGPATATLVTRFQEIGLNRLPQELVFEVRCPGTDLNDAVDRATTLATNDIPLAHIAYEGSPGMH